MKSLKAQELTFSYTNQLILDRISLELRAGEVMVLLGANGAGKTTLLHALCRQLQPDAGTVLVDRQDIANLARRELAREIALMPQHENRSSQLRVIDVVSLGRVPHCGWWLPMTRKDHEVVEQALNASGLCGLRTRRITELSGGEWRRMILARALAQQAHILLLDEPTAGLDLKYQIEVLALVQRMAVKRGMVVVLTLHDLHHASMFGDRLALLSDSALSAIGTPKEVLQPHLIEQAFGVPVTVIAHPVHGTPLVVPRHRPFCLDESCEQVDELPVSYFHVVFTLPQTMGEPAAGKMQVSVRGLAETNKFREKVGHQTVYPYITT